MQKYFVTQIVGSELSKRSTLRCYETLHFFLHLSIRPENLIYLHLQEILVLNSIFQSVFEACDLFL